MCADDFSFLAVSSKSRPNDCSVGRKYHATAVRILLFGLRYFGSAIRILSAHLLLTARLLEIGKFRNKNKYSACD